jgi:farnesyl-diphosphate farnesyltransferase
MTENADQLLRDVSRSFYLSIRALPRGLREPVTLAYLLARTTDTIADTTTVEVERRVELLDKFSAAISGGGLSVPEVKELLEIRQDHSTSPGMEQEGREEKVEMTEGERTLLTSADVFLQELADQPANDRGDIRALLARIIRGQRLDLTRWSGAISALAGAEQLREYTYLVAGCVGEFWTKLCFRKVSGFTARGENEMMELARKYGSGLQLVNILRDAKNDLRAGRCYFPEDELREAGLSAAQVADAPADFLPIYQRWIAEARAGLDAGLEYSIAIEPPRVRIATVLPALIGVRTLELLEEKGLAALRERVKVPRAEVRKMMASAAITLANRSRLRSKRAQL